MWLNPLLHAAKSWITSHGLVMSSSKTRKYDIYDSFLDRCDRDEDPIKAAGCAPIISL